MTTPASLLEALHGQPGLAVRREPVHGVLCAQVDPDRLVEVMAIVLGRLGLTLLFAAGEDRSQSSGQAWVHFLCGRESRELLHLQVPMPADARTLPTLAALSFPASRFEREMRDLLGIMPAGHPDPRPLVRHECWPEGFYPLHASAGHFSPTAPGQPFPFTPVQGEGVYEIPVGPVHAGIIEPGHFRFNVLGETILKMRARLYFTHKGTERLFAGRRPDDGVALAERISGDTSVAHALAYCQAVEALAGVEVPPVAARSRVVLLELERLYNHVSDVGAILGDTGFEVGLMQALRLRELLLRINKRVTGHRLLRGIIVPGGLARSVAAGAIVADLERIVAEFNEVVAIALANTLVADRLEATGRLATSVARDFGVVGVVARACGIARDVRTDYPCAGYADLAVEPVVEQTGDVRARTLVRVREVSASLDLVRRAGKDASDGPVRSAIGQLPPFSMAFGVVEAWRGRLTHGVMADERGLLHRVKVVDPSFFNWPALARALEDNIVPDFPLCNKSFNQSYSGNDL